MWRAHVGLILTGAERLISPKGANRVYNSGNLGGQKGIVGAQ
jgi:hypothetical protein